MRLNLFLQVFLTKSNGWIQNKYKISLGSMYDEKKDLHVLNLF